MFLQKFQILIIFTTRVLKLLKIITFFANKKFTEAELNFDNPDYAAKSAIMAIIRIWNKFLLEAEENLKDI